MTLSVGMMPMPLGGSEAGVAVYVLLLRLQASLASKVEGNRFNGDDTHAPWRIRSWCPCVLLVVRPCSHLRRIGLMRMVMMTERLGRSEAGVSACVRHQVRLLTGFAHI